ncbi:MAG: type II secretion system F family protein [Steroidobacteraceae bacterium]
MNLSVVVFGAALVAGFGLLAMLWRLRAGALWLKGSVSSAVDRQLADAFIFVDPRWVLRTSALVAIAVAAIAWLVELPGWLSLSLAALLMNLPHLALARFRRIRQEQLLRQLPDAMQSLSALLKAGQSLGQALNTLAETQPRPLRDEWQLLLRRLRLGEAPDRLFEQLPMRIAAPESRLLATTIRVALDLGGSLAEALENLATCTRRRLEMQERIRALTAQGRLQGIVVGLLPLLLLGVLTVIDSQAMALLWTRPGGWATLAVIVALEIGGFLLIRRIVRIDV